MNKKCVINFARGAWYPRGQQRLIQSLRQQGWDGDVHTFDDESQIGLRLLACPTHQEAPYAFKAFAFRWARDNGYDLALWADASVWAIKPIQPMFDHIAQHGWMLFYNTITGLWTSDACLAGFGLSRNQAMEIPMIMATCMGFDLHNQKAQDFLDEYLEKSVDGFSLRGSWTNANQEVSTDPRVLGHRHDQSVASIVAWKLGIKDLLIAHESFFAYAATPWPNHEPPKNASVCMLAQGM